MAWRRRMSGAWWGRCGVLLCALLPLVACSGQPNPEEPVNEDDRALADGGYKVGSIGFGADSVMDVHARASLSDAPVAVVLHGGSVDGVEQLEPFASELARRNTVVFVPEWPAITDLGSFHDDPELVLVEQTVVVICALREARAVASQFGGDSDHLTLIATSQAGAVALRVALSAGEAWPEAGCRPAVDHAPQLVIGLAGSYSGGRFKVVVSPIELWRRFDPFRFIDDHRQVRTVFLHGLDDTNVMPQESEKADLALRSAGYESMYLQLEGEHAALIRPWLSAGSFTAALVEQLLNGRQDMLSDRPVVEVVFDKAGCNVTTPPVVEARRPFEARLTNHSDGEVWLLVFRNDGGGAPLGEMNSNGGERLKTHPALMDTAAFRIVAPSSSDDAKVVAENPGEWIVACVVPDEVPGEIQMSFTMFPAAQLRSG